MFNCFKFTLCTLVLLFTTTLVFAQSTTAYYWSDNQKISLNTDRSSLILQFNDGYDVAKYLKANTTSLKDLEIHSIQGRAVLTFNNTVQGTAIEVAKTFVSNAAALKSASFGYQLNDGFQVWPTHHVVLELRKDKTMADLSAAMTESKASFARAKYGRILLEVEDINQVLPFANQLRESGLVTWAHPDFYAKVQHHLTPSDPLYSNQFQMNNSNDVDSDAPEAWDITLGSAGISVAVIDDGLEAHPDLPTTNLSKGYTPANNGNGTPNSSGAHGVSCAGSISAAHNGIGVAGLAPNCEIFSVNIFWGGETNNDLADAISYAKNNGADVLSNSWGFGSCTFSVSALNSALADAKANGRGGKGCVIIFAAGNDYQSCVSYPGNNDNVIGVGAITNTGVRSSYSNQGPKLDISAPSNGGTIGVYTTDRVGSAGYASGDYTGSFGGTSSACPVVAGVAALVLSANGNLTSQQVQDILETTATDMGSPGFDVQFGHGRVDADDAINAALGNPGGGGGGGNPVACTSTVSNFPYTESFENTLGTWTQASGDDFNWATRSGGTPSSNTGPSAANSGSYYVYMESSAPNYSTKTAILNSPCFDLSGQNSTQVSFDYHMYGASIMGNLQLEASTDGTSWSTVWSESGNQGNSWQTATVNLAAYDGESALKLRFNGTTGTTWQGDMAVDAFSITTGGGTGGGCVDVDLTFVFDNYPEETSWTIRNSAGSTVASGGTYGSQADGSTLNLTECLDAGCYTFTINDSYGDGICCAYGNGSYSLTNGSTTLASGGSFGSSEATNFCVGGAGANRTTSNTSPVTVVEQAEEITAKQINLYPNPADNTIHIDLGEITKNYTGRIIDATGRTVWVGELEAGANAIDIANLSTGIYYVAIVKADGEMITKKFVKK